MLYHAAMSDYANVHYMSRRQRIVHNVCHSCCVQGWTSSAALVLVWTSGAPQPCGIHSHTCNGVALVKPMHTVRNVTKHKAANLLLDNLLACAQTKSAQVHASCSLPYMLLLLLVYLLKLTACIYTALTSSGSGLVNGLCL